jgi:uncharacterized repeat protein (TIGR03803 family)
VKFMSGKAVAIGIVAAFGLSPANVLRAQIFTTLHNFSSLSAYETNADGATPRAELVLDNSRIFGTTYTGGPSGGGVVFALNIDGNSFTNLYNFSGYPSDGGYHPRGGVIISDNILFGTASEGGGMGYGTVFKLNSDGTDFTKLRSFNFPDGAAPCASLVLSNSYLFGTTANGYSGYGEVFKILTNGSGFEYVHPFGSSGGVAPYSAVLLSGNVLYGTTFTSFGGPAGVIYKGNTDGTLFTNLYHFTNGTGAYSGPYTNADGAYPYAGLTLIGNVLYGTATRGGTAGMGTVFRINIDGTAFTNLHSFTGANDGRYPYGTLVQSNGTLYGTTYAGGSADVGTIFAIQSNGAGFTNLHSFSGGSEGANPETGLVLCDNILYGTTANGGTSGSGTVFSLSLPPQLTITSIGTDIVLLWPTNGPGFILQSASELASNTVWMDEPSSPSILNGQYAVTNSSSAVQKFFRLRL